jgi:hypothetical protein
MKSSHKIVEITLWTAVFVAGSFVGWFNMGQAEHSPSPSDVMKSDSLTEGQKHDFQSDDDKQQNVNDKRGSAKASGAKTIKGELFRVDDANYFVKSKDGTEIRLHTDKTTDMKGTIKKGDRIEARVNDQNHALSIQAIK